MPIKEGDVVVRKKTPASPADVGDAGGVPVDEDSADDADGDRGGVDRVLATHRCRQAVQENGELDSDDLAVAAGRGEAVPQDRYTAPGQRNSPRQRVRGWIECHEVESDGSRLRSFTHLLTQAHVTSHYQLDANHWQQHFGPSSR